MQFDDVDFMLDSKTTTNIVHMNQVNAMEFGHVITTCKNTFTSQFTNYWVEFNKRQINDIAHTLVGITTLRTSSLLISMQRLVLILFL